MQAPSAVVERGIGYEHEVSLGRVFHLPPHAENPGELTCTPSARLLSLRLGLPHCGPPPAVENLVVDHVGSALDHDSIAFAVHDKIHHIAERLDELEGDAADGIYASHRDPSSALHRLSCGTRGHVTCSPY